MSRRDTTQESGPRAALGFALSSSMWNPFAAMDATQKWLVGVGGGILGVMVTVQLYLHGANRNDMSAMEQRLAGSIAEVAQAVRAQDERLRDVELATAVNDALSTEWPSISLRTVAAPSPVPSRRPTKHPRRDNPPRPRARGMSGAIRTKGGVLGSAG